MAGCTRKQALFKSLSTPGSGSAARPPARLLRRQAAGAGEEEVEEGEDAGEGGEVSQVPNLPLEAGEGK